MHRPVIGNTYSSTPATRYQEALVVEQPESGELKIAPPSCLVTIIYENTLQRFLIAVDVYVRSPAE
jgi:hypothetical protein